MTDQEIDLFNYVVIVSTNERGIVVDFEPDFANDVCTYLVQFPDDTVKRFEPTAIVNTGLCAAKYIWGQLVRLDPLDSHEPDVAAVRGRIVEITGIGYDPVGRIWSYNVDIDGKRWAFNEPDLALSDGQSSS